MKLKIERGILLTEEQLKEVLELIMLEPDMGWNYNEETGKYDKVTTNITCGDTGTTYTYRVNTSWDMITLLKVE